MLYDDGEEEDEDMASQQFRFCPTLPPLDDSLLPVLGRAAVNLEDGAISADHPHDTGEKTASIDLVANAQSVQPSLQQAVQPTALLDATNASRPLPHNPEADDVFNQGNKHTPVSANQPKQLALSTDKHSGPEAAPASDACTAVPKSRPELDPVVHQAAGPQRQADAFDYPALQAENVASHQSASSTAAPCNCKPGSGPGRGRDRGRKRAPDKQLAPAKRQKQLQVPRGTAANKARKAKQTGGKQVADGPHRSRLAETARQVMGTSPGRTDSPVEAVVKAEPQGECANQARQIPATDIGAGAKPFRQLESQQGQLQEQPLQQQQPGQHHHQQQQPVDDVAEQAGAGPNGEIEVLTCLMSA